MTDEPASIKAEVFGRLIAEGEVAAVRDALAADPALASCHVTDATPLHVAARRGRTEIADILLDAGADIEATSDDPEGPRTALHDSYECGQEAVTELLLARGAHYDINVAAARGDVERVRALLADDPTLVNDSSTGLSPLGWAGYGQDPAMVPFLVDHGAVVGDEIGCPCGTGNVAIIQAFLDVGADPDAVLPSWRARPLHVAAAMPFTNRNTDAIELLIAAGARPDGVAADEVTTPLDVARRRLEACDATTEAHRIEGFRAVIDALERHV